MTEKPPRKVTLEIEEFRPLSLNEINSLRASSRYAYTARGRGYTYWLASSARAKSIVPEPASTEQMIKGPCTVTFTRIMCYKEKSYDDDNLIGGLKGVRDALVHHGYISGDGPRSGVKFKYKQKRDVMAQSPSLIIEIVPRRGSRNP